MRMWQFGLGCVEGVHNYMIGVIESYYDWWHNIMICISTKNICCTDALLLHMLCVQRLWVVVYLYIIFSSFPSLLYSSHGVNAQLHIILHCEVRVHTISVTAVVMVHVDSNSDMLFWKYSTYLYILYMYMYYNIMLIATRKDIWTWACLHALMANQWQRYFFNEQIPLTAHSQLAVGSIV